MIAEVLSMPPRFFNPSSFGIELVQLLVVVFSCLFIYFKTSELYKLSSYKGLKYFRNTFLFYGLAVFIRFFFHIQRAIGHNRKIMPLFTFGIIELLFFITAYASSMALIYLILSIFWKKMGAKIDKEEYLLHVIALIIAFISAVIGPFLLIGFQGLLFILLVIGGYYQYKKTKSKGGFSQLYLIYLLLFALWIISDILEFVSLFTPLIGIVVYLGSVAVFLVLLFKVLKKVSKK